VPPDAAGPVQSKNDLFGLSQRLRLPLIYSEYWNESRFDPVLIDIAADCLSKRLQRRCLTKVAFVGCVYIISADAIARFEPHHRSIYGFNLDPHIFQDALKVPHYWQLVEYTFVMRLLHFPSGATA